MLDMPHTLVKSIDEARILFLHTQIWLKRARIFYTLRDHPYIYVNCILDLSELYRYLAYFESDIESQYSVQKRRADALETLSGILKDVRPQCYIAVSVEILRELAEVHLELMGLNMRRLYEMQGKFASFCKSISKILLYLFKLESGKVQDFNRRINVVNELHVKLEKFGNIFGHGNLEEEAESPQNESFENTSETEEMMPDEKLTEFVEPTE